MAAYCKDEMWKNGLSRYACRNACRYRWGRRCRNTSTLNTYASISRRGQRKKDYRNDYQFLFHFVCTNRNNQKTLSLTAILKKTKDSKNFLFAISVLIFNSHDRCMDL